MTPRAIRFALLSATMARNGQIQQLSASSCSLWSERSMRCCSSTIGFGETKLASAITAPPGCASRPRGPGTQGMPDTDVAGPSLVGKRALPAHQCCTISLTISCDAAASTALTFAGGLSSCMPRGKWLALIAPLLGTPLHRDSDLCILAPPTQPSSASAESPQCALQEALAAAPAFVPDFG